MYIYAYLLHLYSYTNRSPPHSACLACYSFAHYSLLLCTSHAYLCVCIVVTSLHHTAIHLSAASHLLVNLCLFTWYSMVSMPCTWLHMVGIQMPSNSCPLHLGQGSVTETTTTPCCTELPILVTVRWYTVSLKNLQWIHRTGTKCLGSEG